jgi:hypothetical protein
LGGGIKYRFLRDHPKLYNFITFKMKQRKLNAHNLGMALGIYPYAIRNYLKRKKPSITDDDIVRICEHLNIKLKLEIEVDA